MFGSAAHRPAGWYRCNAITAELSCLSLIINVELMHRRQWVATQKVLSLGLVLSKGSCLLVLAIGHWRSSSVFHEGWGRVLLAPSTNPKLWTASWKAKANYRLQFLQWHCFGRIDRPSRRKLWSSSKPRSSLMSSGSLRTRSTRSTNRHWHQRGRQIHIEIKEVAKSTSRSLRSLNPHQDQRGQQVDVEINEDDQLTLRSTRLTEWRWGRQTDVEVDRLMLRLTDRRPDKLSRHFIIEVNQIEIVMVVVEIEIVKMTKMHCEIFIVHHLMFADRRPGLMSIWGTVLFVM